MKILVHICCSIDSSYFLHCLQTQYPNAQIIGYFYDPNIHPIEEYELRFYDVARSCAKLNIPLLKAPYDDKNWLDKCSVLAHEPERGRRCDVCFDIRLERSSASAKFLGASHLATTLSCSPKKDLNQLQNSALRIINQPERMWQITDLFDLDDEPTTQFLTKLRAVEVKTTTKINKALIDCAAATQMPSSKLEFLNPDYRQHGGTQKQLELAKSLQLYHQNYCGCAFGLIASRKDVLISELFSSASKEILPNSPKERLELFKTAYELEQQNISFRIQKHKFLNYRLLKAQIVQNNHPCYAAVLFYSHFNSKHAALNINSMLAAKAQILGYLGDAPGEFLRAQSEQFQGPLEQHPMILRAHKDDICLVEFSLIQPFCQRSSIKEWLANAPDINIQLRLRKLITGYEYDLSPIIILDKLEGKLQISALSSIWADSKLELIRQN